jgi:DNA-binding phage protein
MLAGEFSADPDLLMTHANEIQALIDEVYETAHQTQEMIQRCLQLQPGSSTRV